MLPVLPWTTVQQDADQVQGMHRCRTGSSSASKPSTKVVVAYPTYSLERRPVRVVQQHEIAWLYIPVQDAMRVALCERPQDCSHVAGYLHHSAGSSVYSQTAHLGQCLSAALGVRVHRAFTVMSFSKTMGELSAGAELHDNVHVLVVLQCLNEVDDIQGPPQAVQDRHLAFHICQVRRLALDGQIRDLQQLLDGLCRILLPVLPVRHHSHYTKAPSSQLFSKLVLFQKAVSIPTLDGLIFPMLVYLPSVYTRRHAKSNRHQTSQECASTMQIFIRVLAFAARACAMSQQSRISAGFREPMLPNLPNAADPSASSAFRSLKSLQKPLDQCTAVWVTKSATFLADSCRILVNYPCAGPMIKSTWQVL